VTYARQPNGDGWDDGVVVAVELEDADVPRWVAGHVARRVENLAANRVDVDGGSEPTRVEWQFNNLRKMSFVRKALTAAR